MAQKKKPVVKTKTTKPKKKKPLAVKIGQHQHQGDLEAINKRLARPQMELEAAYRQYTDLYDFAPVGYLTLTRNGVIHQVNLAGANLLGVDHNKVTRLRLAAFVSNASRPAFNAFFERLLSGEGKETCELVFEKKGKGLFWGRLEATCFEGGDVCRAMLADITERKRAEEQLQESEKRFRNLVETTSDWIWEIDANGVYTYASPRIRNILGFESSEIIGKRPDDLMPPEEAQRVLGIFTSIFAARSPFSNFENKNLHKDGRVITLETSGVPIVDNDGVFCGYRGIDRDITERKQVEMELQYMKEGLEAANAELQAALVRQQQLAHTDALTGINNRRYLYELAEHEFEIATRYRQPLSVIMFDIDHFKQINDTFGHTVGDHILQRVTQVACAELRSADVIGRYGGEEFVIMLPMTNAHQAYPLAERIRVRVAALCVPTEKGDASVTLSIGIVDILYSPQTDSADDLIRRADEAMYTAKQAGRNRTEIGNQGIA